MKIPPLKEIRDPGETTISLGRFVLHGIFGRACGSNLDGTLHLDIHPRSVAGGELSHRKKNTTWMLSFNSSIFFRDEKKNTKKNVFF